MWDIATGAVLRDTGTMVRRGITPPDDATEAELRRQMAAVLKPQADDPWHREMIGPLAFTLAGRRAVSARPLPGKGADMEELPDGTDVHEFGGLWVWDLDDLGANRRVTGTTGATTCVSVTTDGRYAVTGSAGRVVRLWDLDAGTCRLVLRGHRGMVYSCAVTDDARYAVSGSEDMTVRLWDLRAGTLAFTFGTTSAVTACDIAAGGSVAVAGEVSGRVHVFAVCA